MRENKASFAMAVGRGDMPQRCLWTGWALPRGNCREAAEKASFEMPDGRSEMPQSYLQGSLALRSGVRGLQRETSTTLQIPLWHMGASVHGWFYPLESLWTHIFAGDPDFPLREESHTAERHGLMETVRPLDKNCGIIYILYICNNIWL